jgi:maltodextrin utilization protein YvdJ
MDSKQTPKKHDWFKVTFVLIFVSSFIMLAIGYSLQSVHRENLTLQTFLHDAQNIQGDFENSLAVYTESIQSSLDYLSSLRPKNESGYITFITQVEDIAQISGLQLNIQTSDKAIKPDSTGSFYVDYQLSFNSNADQLWSFVKSLEELSYFVRVVNLDFSSLEKATLETDYSIPNATLTIRLYVK